MSKLAEAEQLSNSSNDDGNKSANSNEAAVLLTDASDCVASLQVTFHKNTSITMLCLFNARRESH